MSANTIGPNDNGRDGGLDTVSIWTADPILPSALEP